MSNSTKARIAHSCDALCARTVGLEKSDRCKQTQRRPPTEISHVGISILMRRIPLHFVVCLAVVSSFIFLTACTSKNNPDEIRRQTAQATETMRRDTKAVVDGVKEGLKPDKNLIDINKASREDLLALPGLSDREADRIVAERPFDDGHDLVKRRIISEAEYDRIQGRIVANR